MLQNDKKEQEKKRAKAFMNFKKIGTKISLSITRLEIGRNVFDD